MTILTIIQPVKWVSEKEFREMYDRDESAEPTIEPCAGIDVTVPLEELTRMMRERVYPAPLVPHPPA